MLGWFPSRTRAGLLVAAFWLGCLAGFAALHWTLADRIRRQLGELAQIAAARKSLAADAYGLRIREVDGLLSVVLPLGAADSGEAIFGLAPLGDLPALERAVAAALELAGHPVPRDFPAALRILDGALDKGADFPLRDPAPVPPR